MVKQTAQFALALLACGVFMLLGSTMPVVAQQNPATKQAETTEPAPDTLLGEVFHGALPGKIVQSPSSVCAYSELGEVKKGTAAGPYSDAFGAKLFSANIRKVVSVRGKFDFNADFGIATASEKKVSGHMTRYEPPGPDVDPQGEMNYCRPGLPHPGVGSFGTNFVTQYTADIRTPKGVCSVSGKARITASALIAANLLVEGGLFEVTILDSTACAHP